MGILDVSSYIRYYYRRLAPSSVCLQTFPGFEESPALPEHAVFSLGGGVADTIDVFTANEVTNTITTSIAIKIVGIIFFIPFATYQIILV